MRWIRSACFVAASAVAVVVSFTSPSQAATPASGNTSSGVISAAAANATLQYWTPERMASAKNADVIVADGHDAPSAAAPSAPGPMVTVPPTAGALGDSSDPKPTAATAIPRPYTDLPSRLNGKVFFTEVNGQPFVCSGTLASSQNQDLVDTAGHCVSDGRGHFHSNWIFVPAYSSQCSGCGDEPYGRWTARLLTVRAEWHNFSNFKEDLGYGVLNTLNGSHAVARLGGQGSTFNRPRTLVWQAYGYPQAAPFNGFDQYMCQSGRLSDDDPSPGRSGPLTIQIDCNMTGGASGGGWLSFSSGGLGYINSHNDYKRDPDTMYGPYYGDEALSLFQYTQVL